MIPNFPEFKKLELTDQSAVEQITKQYEPYSDFNFVNTWCWGKKWDSEISILNGNLVFHWVYEDTNEDIYSYLGKNQVTETCKSLFEYVDFKHLGKGKLSYIPEISLLGMDFSKYYIEIFTDACDYIYDLDELSLMSGNKYTPKRNRLNNFKLSNPSAQVKVFNSYSQILQKDILELHKLWIDKKDLEEDFFESETTAMSRFFDSNFENTVCIGVYNNEQLISYAIYAIHNKDYAVNIFIKSDINYKGIYEFIMQESALMLSDLGLKYMNFLEDLGMVGLQQSKKSYRPKGFLMKYKVFQL